MGLNTRSVYDPRLQGRVAATSNAAMTSSVLVRRPLSAPAAAVWNYETQSYDGDDSDYLTLWTGPASVNPEPAESARDYEVGMEATAFQVVTFSLPLALGAWDASVDHHDFNVLDEVIITANFFPFLDTLKRYIFVVRNPVGSSTDTVYHLVCDVNMKGGVNRG